jgi:hypothetical protein
VAPPEPPGTIIIAVPVAFSGFGLKYSSVGFVTFLNIAPPDSFMSDGFEFGISEAYKLMISCELLGIVIIKIKIVITKTIDCLMSEMLVDFCIIVVNLV